ncbi:MAG: SUMF1/EgtB/PvdO family nonheme iron enzyme [Planctomycetes bacterium]|nr:SUMF1/EgtB/PvdO family nonheme iron enzyme [Planctomycetota bacterium]
MRVAELHPDPDEAVLVVEGVANEPARASLRLLEAGKDEVRGTLEIDGIGALTEALRTQVGCREVWAAIVAGLEDRPTTGWRRVILAVDPTHAAAELEWEGLLIRGEPVFLDARCELVRTWLSGSAVRPAGVRGEDAGAFRVLVLLGDIEQQWAEGAPDHALTSVTAEAVREITREVCEALAKIEYVEATVVAPGWSAASLAIQTRDARTIDDVRAWLRGEKDKSGGFDAVVFVGHSNAVFDGATSKWCPATALCFRIDGARSELSFVELRTDLQRTRTHVLMLHSCWTPAPTLHALGDAAEHVVAWRTPINPQACRIATRAVFTKLCASPPGRLGDAVRLARASLGEWAGLLWHFAHDPHVEAFIDTAGSAFAVFRETSRKELLRLPSALEGYADGAQVLQELYVELAVARGKDAEHAAAFALRGAPGPRPLLSWIEDPAFVQRFVLCGEPGSGKSTLLRHLAVQLLDRGWVAVYLTVQSVLDAKLTDVLDLANVAQFLHRERIERARASGRIALLLDGLDEVEDRAAAEKRISLLGTQLGGGCLVVASRTDGFQPFDDDFVVARVCELDDAGQERLVRNWFRVLHEKPAVHGHWRWLAEQGVGATDHVAAATEAVVAEFGRRRPLAIVCRCPLALTLCVLRIAAEGLEGLPASRYATLDWLARFLLANEHRAERPFEELESPRRLLGRLALFMLERGVAQCELVGPDHRWSKLGAQFQAELPADLRSALGAGNPRAWIFSRKPTAASRTLADRLRISGVIEPVDRHSDRKLRFPIQSLADFLAADALREGFAEDLAGMLVWLEQRKASIAQNLARWSETLALCTTWQGARAKDWLFALAKIDRRLGLRALGRADRPPVEAVVALVERGEASDKLRFWDGFAENFGIETRDDAERALELIEQAAPHLSSGTDRCLMEEEAAIAAGRFGLSCDRVRRVIRCQGLDRAIERDLFAKPPASDERLWKRIEFREDGEDRSFWMMAVPVTVGMYRVFDPQHRFGWRGKERSLQEAVSFDPSRYDSAARASNTEFTTAHPVAVCWFDAVAFTRWLNQAVLPRTRELIGCEPPPGWHFRLPTEREWEWACRAGTTTEFWCGKELTSECAWFGEHSAGAPHPVGLLRANALGLRDMHGNAWDWCLDAWHQPIEPSAGRSGRGSDRVLRGGSCWVAADLCRSAYRYWYVPAFRFGGGDGFRPVLAAPLPRSGSVLEDR